MNEKKEFKVNEKKEFKVNEKKEFKVNEKKSKVDQTVEGIVYNYPPKGR